MSSYLGRFQLGSTATRSGALTGGIPLTFGRASIRTPNLATQQGCALVHHTMGNGDFNLFHMMAGLTVCASASMTPQNATSETEWLIAEELYFRQPARERRVVLQHHVGRPFRAHQSMTPGRGVDACYRPARRRSLLEEAA